MFFIAAHNCSIRKSSLRVYTQINLLELARSRFIKIPPSAIAISIRLTPIGRLPSLYPCPEKARKPQRRTTF